RPPVSGQHSDADVVAVPHLAQGVGEALRKFAVNRIELGRPVERDRRDASVVSFGTNPTRVSSILQLTSEYSYRANSGTRNPPATTPAVRTAVGTIVT